MALNLPPVGPNDVWGNLINSALSALDQRLAALESTTPGDAMAAATEALNTANAAQAQVTSLSSTVAGLGSAMDLKVDKGSSGPVRIHPVSTSAPNSAVGNDGDLYFQADP